MFMFCETISTNSTGTSKEVKGGDILHKVCTFIDSMWKLFVCFTATPNNARLDFQMMTGTEQDSVSRIVAVSWTKRSANDYWLHLMQRSVDLGLQ